MAVRWLHLVFHKNEFFHISEYRLQTCIYFTIYYHITKKSVKNQNQFSLEKDYISITHWSFLVVMVPDFTHHALLFFEISCDFCQMCYIFTICYVEISWWHSLLKSTAVSPFYMLHQNYSCGPFYRISPLRQCPIYLHLMSCLSVIHLWSLIF